MSAALRLQVCARGSEDGSDCSLEAEGLVAGVPGRVWDDWEERCRTFIWISSLANEVADSNRRYDDERSNDDYNRKLVWERFLLIHGGEFPRV